MKKLIFGITLVIIGFVSLMVGAYKHESKCFGLSIENMLILAFVSTICLVGGTLIALYGYSILN